VHTEPEETSTTYISESGEALPILLVVPRQQPPRSGVIFFHGGGWIGGGPEQFLPQCHALARAGILSATARYRLLGLGAATLADCVADARSAIGRFLDVAAQHDLGPSRVAAGGGSAGAHLALSVALSPPGTAHNAGARTPGALVLFNPVVDLRALSVPFLDLLRHGTNMRADELAEFSPVRFVRPDAPSTLVFHGTDDSVVPLDSVRRFRDLMKAAGNRCELVEFAGADHGFFNARPEGNPMYDETLAVATEFLLAPK
jgi:acetyl esterase